MQNVNLIYGGHALSLALSNKSNNYNFGKADGNSLEGKIRRKRENNQEN